MTAVPGVLSYLLVLPLMVASPAPDDELGTPSYRLEPVVVEAPRLSPIPVFPGARTVLDRDWLRRRDPLDLGEALVAAAGVRVFSLGDGATRAVSVRGLGPDRTAVLVDGQLRNTAQGGGVDLGSVDLEGVERIEVARGAMGALYGPYALGGAVHVVNRRDRESSTSWRVLAGTQHRAELRGRVGWVQGRSSASAEAEYRRAAPDLDGQTAESESGGGEFRLGYTPPWAAAVDLTLLGRTDLRDVPGSRDFPSPEARRRDNLGQMSLAVHGLHLADPPGLFEASLTGFRFEREFSDPGYALGALHDTHRNDRASVSLGWQGEGPVVSPSLRVEAVRDRLVSTTDGVHSRDRGALAGFLEVGSGRWTLSGAARLDALQEMAPELTGRAGLARALWGTPSGPDRASLRAGVGTSFRPPSFDDLFWPARATAAGNPELRPERAWDLDLGLEARSGRSRVQLSAYYSEVEDLIQWVPGPDGAWRPHNLGRAVLSGLELDGTYHRNTTLGDITLDGALSRARAEDATRDPSTGGRQLVGRSQWIGSATLAWQPGPLGFSWGLRGVDRVPLTAANTKWQDGYLLWDASIAWRVGPGLRFELEGINLFDTDYEDLRGYATAGREVLASIRLHTGSEDR